MKHKFSQLAWLNTPNPTVFLLLSGVVLTSPCVAPQLPFDDKPALENLTGLVFGPRQFNCSGAGTAVRCTLQLNATATQQQQPQQKVYTLKQYQTSGFPSSIGSQTRLCSSNLHARIWLLQTLPQTGQSTWLASWREIWSKKQLPNPVPVPRPMIRHVIGHHQRAWPDSERHRYLTSLCNFLFW